MTVVDYLFGTHMPDAVFAVEAIRGPDGMGIQSPGGHENLKGGARLQAIGDGAVAPGKFRELPEMVGIHGGGLGHGQNFSGLRTHYQGHAVFGVPFFHPRVQFLFGDILDSAVQGEDHVISHDVRVPGLHPGDHDVAPGVGHLPAFFGFAVKLLIIL